MLEAFGVGALAQISLLIAGVAVCWITVPRKIVGILAGFGAGAMIAAVAFDLIPQADALADWALGGWMLVGVAVFLAGDWLVERKYGDEGEGGAMGIVVGSVVDGVPESIILGIGIASGEAISVSFVAAILVSNIPQALAPSAELVSDGWSAPRLGRLWTAVVLACGVASALGWLAGDLAGDVTGSAMAALAAGGLLAMLTDSLIPFAYERGGQLAGAATVVGFCLSLGGT